MAVSGMVKAVSRSETARVIMRIFLGNRNKIKVRILFSREKLYLPCANGFFCNSNYQIDIEET